MSFDKKTIKDINLSGKRVLLRADYNVPIENGRITDDYRIKKSLTTIEYLLSKKCTVIIISHLGRPDGRPDSRFSLEPVAKSLQKNLGTKVKFVSDCIGELADSAVSELKPGEVLLLENLRFYPEEEQNDKDFAKQLSKHGDIFVQDGFGVVHRAHASTEAITKYLPSVAGLLLNLEVETINNAMMNPKKPLMAIIGGSKISDKIEIINRFIDEADVVAIGGAMANTFLLAEGIKTGKSLVESSEKSLARNIIDRAKERSKKDGFVFYVPQDGVVAKKVDKSAHTRIVDWDAHVIASIENYPSKPPRQTALVADDEMILDIGPFSGAFIAGCIQLAETVIWNGVMGVTETDGVQGPIGPFAHGTDIIIDAMVGEYGNKPFTIVGGGDTVGYVEERGLIDLFGHVSTGGGASMELMSGKKLPGVEALINKG